MYIAINDCAAHGLEFRVYGLGTEQSTMVLHTHNTCSELCVCRVHSFVNQFACACVHVRVRMYMCVHMRVRMQVCMRV